MSFVCETCGKSFDRKAGLTQHKGRKTACLKPVNVIEEPSLLEATTFQNTAISLFSGCGGDTLGLEKAGFKVVGFSELRKTFIETHLENFPDSKPIMNIKGDCSDITKIEDCQFEKYKGMADIIFAGFPCQGFSNAGKKQLQDPRNQMYTHFVRATKAVRPLFIIGENVQGLEHMRSGPLATDPLMIDKIAVAFEEIGYSISHKIHEATAFGVPQKRKRVLIIGWDNQRIKKFMPTKFWLSVATNGASNTMKTMRSFVTNSMEGAYRLPAGAVPEGFATYALPVPLGSEPVGSVHPYVKLKVDENLLSCCKRVSPVHSEVIDLDSPSKTIICTYGHQPRLLVGLLRADGASFVRTLLPDELQQIQGFPADYKIKGSLSEKITQIGNAVPSQMIEAVAKAIRTAI
jgi:DNA (cytosine-5)-methyltransferase 1